MLADAAVSPGSFPTRLHVPGASVMQEGLF